MLNCLDIVSSKHIVEGVVYISVKHVSVNKVFQYLHLQCHVILKNDTLDISYCMDKKLLPHINLRTEQQNDFR